MRIRDRYRQWPASSEVYINPSNHLFEDAVGGGEGSGEGQFLSPMG